MNSDQAQKFHDSIESDADRQREILDIVKQEQQLDIVELGRK